MNPTLFAAHCPACGHNVAAPFFDGGLQTLATLAWPASMIEAQALPRHPLDFVQCPACSHVYNRAFEYAAIPYQNNPNRMFNKGEGWRGHLADTRDALLSQLPANPVLVEIGCGEGHFIRGLAESSSGGRFVGFDPNASPETGQGVEFYPRLFDPFADMEIFLPDAVVIRHVLEHLTEPAVFLESLAWSANALGKPCWLFAEVPCIDRVFETDRLADFFYEHVSHFTTLSFQTLMSRSGTVKTLAHGYDGEVVYALVRLGVQEEKRQRAMQSAVFAARTVSNRLVISRQLDELFSGGKRVAIWGGTGKAAAFIHHFGADASRFPLVVDSDPDKTGTFVPGTGQQIQFRDVLKSIQPDVVIIPTQWRARDIIAEMKRKDIHTDLVLIEHNGLLVDFKQGAHPY